MEVFKGKLLLELEYNATFRPIDLGMTLTLGCSQSSSLKSPLFARQVKRF